MNKLLVALDDSSSAMKAVEYVARHFGATPDLQIGLVYVLPNLPAVFWDEGHIFSEEEKKSRKTIVDKWLADRAAKMKPVFEQAIGMLTTAGVGKERITVQSISDSTDAAASIVEVARDKGYETIVTGRCDRSPRHLLGSVTGRIVSQGAGLTVTVVE